MIKTEFEVRKYREVPDGKPYAAMGFLGKWQISKGAYDFVANVKDIKGFARFVESIDYEDTPLLVEGPAIDIERSAKEFKVVTSGGVGIWQHGRNK